MGDLLFTLSFLIDWKLWFVGYFLLPWPAADHRILLIRLYYEGSPIG